MPGQKVFFSSISYSNTIISSRAKRNLSDLNNFTLITGIANPDTLVNYLKIAGKQFEHMCFPDHYEFASEDVKDLASKPSILTTEKDFMRLKQYEALEDKLFYLPIEVTISESEVFNKAVLDFVASF